MNRKDHEGLLESSFLGNIVKVLVSWVLHSDWHKNSGWHSFRQIIPPQAHVCFGAMYMPHKKIFCSVWLRIATLLPGFSFFLSHVLFVNACEMDITSRKRRN